MDRKRILIVDDHPVILKALSLKLSTHGYDVFTAEDGPSAVSKVRKIKPDLIILDVSFPPDVGHGGGVPWDGFLIMSWLRRMDEAVNVPFIIITGTGSPEVNKRALAAGAAGFLHKPLDHDELLKVMSQALEQHASEPEFA